MTEYLRKRSGGTNNDEYGDYVFHSQKIYPTTGTPTNSPANVLQFVQNSAYVGWDIPDFHRRRRQGELLSMTPWLQRFHNGEAGQGDYDCIIRTTSNGYEYRNWCDSGNYTIARFAVTADEVEAYAPNPYDKYVQEAAAKIYSEGHDTLTFLAEMADVKRLFTDIVKKLLDPRSFPDRFWAIARSKSSDWLSYRYGWRTLIYDLQDLNKALLSLDEKISRYAKHAGDTYSFTNIETYTLPYYSFYLECSIEDKVEIGIRGSVVADCKVPKFQFNPLQTGWELIPFSFVIDWIVSIGKALASWSLLSLDMNYVAAAGYKVTVNRTFSSEYSEPKDGFEFLSGSCSASGESEGILEVRTPCRIPVLPHYKLRLGTAKYFDLVALLIQRTRR